MTAKSTIRRHCVSLFLSDAEHEKLRCLGQSVWAARAINDAWESLSVSRRESLARMYGNQQQKGRTA